MKCPIDDCKCDGEVDSTTCATCVGPVLRLHCEWTHAYEEDEAVCKLLVPAPKGARC